MGERLSGFEPRMNRSSLLMLGYKQDKVVGFREQSGRQYVEKYLTTLKCQINGGVLIERGSEKFQNLRNGGLEFETTL